MKRIIAILVAALCIAAVANAQPKALGLRATYGAELSYQHYAGGSNFWEFDAGLFDNLLDLVAIYDFSIAPVGPFNFFMGPGAFLAKWLAGRASEPCRSTGCDRHSSHSQRYASWHQHPEVRRKYRPRYCRYLVR